MNHASTVLVVAMLCVCVCVCVCVGGWVRACVYDVMYTYLSYQLSLFSIWELNCFAACQ